MGDYREQLLVRSRETYLLIYNTDHNKSSAVPQRIKNWPLSSFRLNHWRVRYPTAESLLQQNGGRNFLLGVA